jgi:hypothetical protein
MFDPQEVDLAIASLTASTERKEVVDFVEYFSEHGSIIVRMPRKEDSAYKVLVLPFDWSMWTAIIISGLLIY